MLKRSYNIWIITILLCAFGLLMVYSASGFSQSSDSSMQFVKKQILFMVLGFVACFCLQFLDYRMFYKLAKIIWIFSVGSILLLVTPLGVSANGATRWLNLGFQFQVAEVVKIGVIVAMAYILRRFSKQLNKMQMVFLMWIIGGVTAALLFGISNDLSSSLVVLVITFGMSFIYTKDLKLHLSIATVAIIVVVVYVLSIWNNMPSPEEIEDLPFRVARIAAWLDPERYADGAGYQTLQAMYAIGRGGFWGQGLGDSIQKIAALPEAQNDMIFAIVCEELGVFGASLMIFMYGYLVSQMYKSSTASENVFGSALVTGIMLHIGVQTFINIAVNVNLFPNTGIGLPFVSYGGTATMCQLAEIGILLSVQRDAEGEKVYNVIRYFSKLKERRVR